MARGRLCRLQVDGGSARGLASEVEFTFRQNHINRIATSTPITLGGDLHSYAIMLNGYYRFLNSMLFTPYIGGGIGEATTVLNNNRFAEGSILVLLAAPT